MIGNIPGGNFLGGNFLGGHFPEGSLMGGIFPGGNFSRTKKNNASFERCHNACITKVLSQGYENLIIPKAVTQRCSVRKDVPRNFALFTGKQLCLRLWHGCFSVNFVKFLRTPFLTDHLRWMLLSFSLTNVGLSDTGVKKNQRNATLMLEPQKKLNQSSTICAQQQVTAEWLFQAVDGELKKRWT